MAEERKTISLLGQEYILDILTSLSKSPKRFSDLSEACSNEGTRTIRLKLLKKAGLIETISIEVEKRAFIHYRLTERGKKILSEAVKLEKL